MNEQVYTIFIQECCDYSIFYHRLYQIDCFELMVEEVKEFFKQYHADDPEELETFLYQFDMYLLRYNNRITDEMYRNYVHDLNVPTHQILIFSITKDTVRNVETVVKERL